MTSDVGQVTEAGYPVQLTGYRGGACEQGGETLEECNTRNMLTGEVTAMPRYAFICEKCRKPFELTMTLSEREKSKVSCPTCKSTKVTAQLAPFMTQTSKKS